MKHKKLNITIIVISLIALIVYLFYAEGPDNIAKALIEANPVFLAFALLMILVYWIFEAGIFHKVVKIFYKHQKFSNTFRVSMIGQFFNCVTPFSSGGQPMQAYSMVKSGVPLGKSTCALLIKFVIYQITLTLYSIVVLIFKWPFFSNNVSSFGYLVFIGFAINTAVVLALLSVCFFKNGTMRFCRFCIKTGHKIKLIKKPEEKLESMEREINEFYECFTVLRQHKALVLYLVFLSAVQLTVYFLIPYFLYIAFGAPNPNGTITTIIAAQSFVTMISAFVPLPGAAGGAELSFYTFFEMFFKSSTVSFVNVALLLWRFITFYLPIGVGLFFVFIKRDDKKS